jgi:hypothetical protein
MTETCHDCKEEFNTWVELAQHLVSQRTTHKRESVVWAETFIARRKNVVEFKQRSPMSDETRQIIKDCKRELSGETKEVRTVCPDCHKVNSAELAVEYIQDGEAWRNSNGTYIAMCEKCKGLYRSNKIKRDNFYKNCL